MSRSLDADARTRRYLWTMGLRVACIVAMLFVPGWWRIALLGGAAFLPAMAVLLANAADRRSHVDVPEETAHIAIATGPVVPGHLAHDGEPGRQR